MQKFFKNQKILIAVIGLAMLGTGNAQAISSFDKQASDWAGNSNILLGLEVSDSVAQKGNIKYVKNDSIAISDYSPALPTKAVAQFAVKGASGSLDGWLNDGLSIDLPLSTRAYLNNDVPNTAFYDGTPHMHAVSLATLIPFHSDAEGVDIPSPKATTDENIKVSPVPLPAAAWMFLVGLMGILGLKKCKNPPSEAS